MPDTLSRLLAELPSGEPSPARAQQTRLRCRSLMQRQARPAARVDAQGSRPPQVWQPLGAVLGIAYMTGAIIETLRVFRLFVD